ncbi:shares a domain with poly ribose glycohydrolases [Cryptosporidium sp. chipmunk genotype I]|uniref:shares a domain with poly ribose glycohydrolases n=1 Tax=Cryptosporidium sp. chipmunk genotype I TaxID=1280935 RepID=UPI003519DF25|nr:shares a domain with poly ribose glycohydrolases [Cryptosporidium sp. chipmunk genotype I]
MNTIRYVFHDSGIWGKVTSFISSNYQSVNSQNTLRKFVKDLGIASNNNQIKSSTEKISTKLESAFSNADAAQSSKFFSSSFPVLSQSLVRLTDNLIDNELPRAVILQKTNATQIFTRKFIVLMLFAGFLGLFPGHIFNQQVPGLDFTGFFGGTRASSNQLSCFLSYFNIMAGKISSSDQEIHNHVIFQRHHKGSNRENFFTSSNLGIKQTQIIQGFMESYNPGGHVVEAIFANMMYGSATLHNVMNQEEIVMTIAPETLLGRIFYSDLHDEDSITVRGVMKFSGYTGFGTNNFTFRPIKESEIYAAIPRVYAVVDAISRGSTYTEFTLGYALRELSKLISALCDDFYGETEENDRSPFVSGYWGGGVFGGDNLYKFLIQLIAACVCNRQLVYSDGLNKLDISLIRQIETKYGTCGNLASAFFKKHRTRSFSSGNALVEMLR